MPGIFTYFKELNKYKPNKYKQNFLNKNKEQIFYNIQKIIKNTDVTKLSENNKKIFLKLEFNIKKGLENFNVEESVKLIENYEEIEYDKERDILYFIKEKFPNTVKEP